MTNSLKTLLSLFAVLVFVTACSSTDTTDTSDGSQGADTSGSTDSSVTEQTVEEPEADPMDQLDGVDSVFYFDFDEALLKQEARSALMIHAAVIKETNSSVRLEGHADERGSREYNMALGERRANAVRDFLVLQGVPSYLIETVSYGEERPAALGSNESAWAKNRRVEIVY